MDGKRFIANVKGVGIKGVTREFYMSAKSDELTGGSWSTEIPNLGNNKYLWYRDKFALTNGTVATTTPICDGVWEAIYNIYDINGNMEEYDAKVEEVSNKLYTITGNIDEITNNVDELRREIQPVERGGTGAVTAADALNNLGAASKDHTHKFGEVLVSGADWQLGKKRTIANISKYTLYLVKLAGYATPLIGIRYGSRLQAIGGYVTESPNDDQKLYIACFTISGTSVTLESSAVMTHRDLSNHGEWAGPGVEYLKGLI